MRQWINLIESMVPNPSKFVTDQLINRIITTRKFVSHSEPDNLREWYEEAVAEGIFPDHFYDEDIGFDHAVDLPEFREILTMWLRGSRSRFVQDHLEHISPMTILQRSMIVPKSWIVSLVVRSEQPIPLGIYWTMGEPHSYGASEEQFENGVEIILSTHVRDVEINWQYTIESHFDWVNGDNEEEIQLISNTPIRNVVFKYRSGEIIPHNGNVFIS